MIEIYCILLYLQQIICGSTYTQGEMDAILIANQSNIQMIQNDQQFMQYLTVQYDSSAQIIVTTNSEIKF